MSASARCIATTQAGKPCPMPKWGNSEYCVGHDPAITKEQRDEWRKRPSLRAAPDYDTMSPSNIIEYVSKKVHDFEEKYGHTTEIMPVIAELLRVALAAHKLMHDKNELRKTGTKTEGPRKIRIVRDELSDAGAAADAV